jgi:hypothetical protein
MSLKDEQNQARDLNFHALNEFFPIYLNFIGRLYLNIPVLVKVKAVY